MNLFVLPYPVIDPVAIEVGPVAVRWYGLAYMAGILLGWLYGRYLVSRPALWGGKPAMTEEQIEQARAMMDNPKLKIKSIIKTLGVSKATLYKYVPMGKSAKR